MVFQIHRMNKILESIYERLKDIEENLDDLNQKDRGQIDFNRNVASKLEMFRSEIIESLAETDSWIEAVEQKGVNHLRQIFELSEKVKKLEDNTHVKVQNSRHDELKSDLKNFMYSVTGHFIFDDHSELNRLVNKWGK